MYENIFNKSIQRKILRVISMKHEAELNFVKALLNNFHLSFTIVKSPMILPFSPVDFGLRQLFCSDYDYSELSVKFEELCQPNTIYRIKDFSFCHYLVFRIPDEGESVFAVIGPYTLTAISQKVILDIFSKFSYPPETLSQLEKYYQEVPLVLNESQIFTLVYTLGARLWGQEKNFSFQDVPSTLLSDPSPERQKLSRPAKEFMEPQKQSEKPSEPFLSMKVLEKRYSDENELVKAVSTGQSHKAIVLYNSFLARQMEQRLADPLRNAKNYMIILNTLLRKAAEQASVHPLHIDSISSQYARRIELCVSPNAVDALGRDMIHNYCLLVQNYSLKNYSLLVQKVLTQIDTDLTADLSLNAQAGLLNVNSSYLSTLFKKETGTTLTEYVNKKRIRHAVFLLNTTTMQIQMVAQHCGIPDVNYFTKTFKKYIGKTPKEYRDFIKGK